MAPLNENEQHENRFIKITFDWIRTPLGMLLIGELVMSFLCGCCEASLSTWYGSGCAGKIAFLGTVTWTAFLNILIDMIIKILGLWERLLWIFRHPLVHLALCGLAIFGYLLSSALVASCSSSAYVFNSGAAVAASIFGFVCLGLFACEAFLHFKRYRNMQSEGRHQTEEEVKADVI